MNIRRAMEVHWWRFRRVWGGFGHDRLRRKLGVLIEGGREGVGAVGGSGDMGSVGGV